MLENFIISRIKAELPFIPNEEKEELFALLGQFLVRQSAHKCFLLKGYAGTGKTSVVSALVRALEKLNRPCILLAPTGRAAKVLARYSGYNAFTIHKWIYRRDAFLKESFSLAQNKFAGTLFIVDEGSMISVELLNDLIKYVYSGEDCSMLLLGDDAQLPPVEMDESNALVSDYLRGYGLEVMTYTLTQVARQALDSGILRNATTLRERLAIGDWRLKNGNLGFRIFDWEYVDFVKIAGNELQELLERAYAADGAEETIILTRSNKRTNLYNNGVRSSIMWKEDALSNGDRLMISRNNYFWTKEYDNLPFLANGDMCEVVRLRHEREMYGYKFADATLRLVDYDWDVDAVVWLDTLYTDSPEKSYAMQRTLFSRIAEDYPEIKNKQELVKLVRENEYYNALQIRFAYAVTCHKAQGGQWKHVFIDTGNLLSERGEDAVLSESEEIANIRWLYTAITRATERVYLL